MTFTTEEFKENNNDTYSELTSDVDENGVERLNTINLKVNSRSQLKPKQQCYVRKQMLKAKAAMLQEKASELLQREEQQKQASEGKKRKCLSVPRRLFPPHVVTHLESLFDTEKYIKENQIEEISLATNLNEKQIRSWFKQRRFRYNLENREKGI